AEQPFDVVFTDVFMPHTDGLEVIRKLRVSQHPPRIVATSANPHGYDPDYLEVAQRLGAEATVEEPFTTPDLARVVAKLKGAVERGAWAGSPQALSRKSVPRAGFQIPLEFQRFLSVRECDVGNQPPGNVFRRVR